MFSNSFSTGQHASSAGNLAQTWLLTGWSLVRNPARGAKQVRGLAKKPVGSRDLGAPFGAPRWASGGRLVAFRGVGLWVSSRPGPGRAPAGSARAVSRDTAQGAGRAPKDLYRAIQTLLEGRTRRRSEVPDRGRAVSRDTTRSPVSQAQGEPASRQFEPIGPKRTKVLFHKSRVVSRRGAIVDCSIGSSPVRQSGRSAGH